MADELARVTLSPPQCPLIQNFTAQAETDPGAIRRNLIEQVTGRVRWVESVRAIKAMGIAAGLEVGPGKVLAGLVKRCADGLAGGAMNDLAGLEAALAAVKG